MGADGPSAGENREAPRVPGRVHYAASRIEGTGYIEDISLKGAHITEVSHRFQTGATVQLTFALSEGAPVEISAEVVRKTDRGFAVKFVRVDPRVQNLLLAAVPASRDE